MTADQNLRSLGRAIRWHSRSLVAVSAAICLMACLAALRPPPPETTAVVVTTQAIAAGKLVTDSDIAVKELPREAIPESALRDPSKVLGRQLSARRMSGTILTDADLAGSSLVSSNSDEVLVPFRLDDAAILPLLTLGDHITIVGARSDGATETLATNVRVAALPEPPTSDKLVSNQNIGALVVVALDATSALQLAAATTQWKLAVVLHGS